MKLSLNHVKVILILIVEANFYDCMEYTPVILSDSLANTTLNENSAEACSD